MYRTAGTVLVLLTGTLVAASQADEGGLKVGKPFAGEITAENKNSSRLPDVYYAVEVPIKLKAGQSISFKVTMKGQGRKAALILEDPTGATLANSNATMQTSSLRVAEVGATGEYKIVVLSNLIGTFTLTATGPSGNDDKDEQKLLEEEIQQLKQKLKKLEERLSALKKAKTKPKE